MILPTALFLVPMDKLLGAGLFDDGAVGQKSIHSSSQESGASWMLTPTDNDNGQAITRRDLLCFTTSSSHSKTPALF